MTAHADPKRPRPRRSRGLPTILGLSLSLAGADLAATTTDSMRFRVYLDQDPIGEHSFQISPDQGGEQIVSRASFDVKLLIFNAYRYRHESRETWREGCLERILSTTDDNGTAYRVAGEQGGDALTIRVNGDRKRLPQCVSTFAYWDRNFLKQSSLLNPQTGEMVAVRAEPARIERRLFQGREVDAERYRLRADKLDITLWYTPDGRWIGLESDAGRGRTLRYELL
jgi:hypothetical protein